MLRPMALTDAMAMLASVAPTWSGQVTNDGVWWLGALIALILILVFIVTPLIDSKEDTGHDDDY